MLIRTAPSASSATWHSLVCGATFSPSFHVLPWSSLKKQCEKVAARPATQLDADTRSGRVPRPARFLHLRRDLHRLVPVLAVVAAGRDEDIVIVARERQPDDTGALIDDRARVADGDLCRPALLVDERQRPPGLSAVEAPLEHQVDVAVVLAASLAALAKGQQRPLRRDQQRR